jgi:predicted DNA-binding transcriptional regulator AlpA
MAHKRHGHILVVDGGCPPANHGAPPKIKVAAWNDRPRDGEKPNPNSVVESNGGGKMRRAPALPSNLPPRGLSREQAAEYVGIGTTLFDRMVADGRMPKPWHINGRVLWDRRQVDRKLDALDSGAVADDPDEQMAL